MKKALMVLTGTLALIGTASAGSVNSPVSAKVDNLCVYQTTAGKDVKDTNFAGASIKLGSYKANADMVARDQGLVTVVCNRGTSLSRSFSPGITLTKANSSSTLLVLTTDSTDKTVGTGNSPDSYEVEADLTIGAGQWGAEGGDYTGSLVVTLNYN